MFVRNIYIRVTSNAFTAGLAVVTYILIVKTYGIETIGQIAYHLSLAGIASIFADLGISSAYNKFLASRDDNKDIATFFFFKVVLTAGYVLFFLLLYFLKYKNSEVDDKLLWILFGVMIMDLVAQFFTCTLTGKREFLFLSKIEIIASLLLCVCNLLVCFVFVDKYFLAANLGIFYLVISSGGIFYFVRNKLFKMYRPGWSDIKEYINFSIPIAFSSITGRIILFIDKLLLAKFIGIRELGYYQIAFKCYAYIDRLIKPVTTTMFTEIVHRTANNASFFKEKFRDLVQVLCFAGGVLVLAILFLSTPIVRFFFGDDSIRIAFILKFFSLVVLAKLFWRPYAHILLAIEKHKLIMYLEPLNLVVMILAYYYLMPLHVGGIALGAAVLPLTEFIIWCFPAGVLRIWILKKQYGNIHMKEVFLKIFLPLLLLVYSGYLFTYPIAGFPIAVFLFFICGYLTGTITVSRLKSLLAPLKFS